MRCRNCPAVHASGQTLLRRQSHVGLSCILSKSNELLCLCPTLPRPQQRERHNNACGTGISGQLIDSVPAHPSVFRVGWEASRSSK